MKMCPQCEFIYEDDQSFCDMDGKELVNNPSPFIFAEGAAARPGQFADVHAARTVTAAPDPTPSLTPSPLPAPARLSANHLPSRWQSRSLAVTAVAAVVLVALLFVVYYARTHQSETKKANRSPSQATSQANSEAHSQPASRAVDSQSAVADSASESATPLADTITSEQTPPQSSDQSSESGEVAGSPNLTPLTPQSSSAVALASGKSLPRVRPGSNPVSARASSETGRAPVMIRLTNGASIKADEAWEKKEGIWYRQAGMVTFLKRSRVRSIQRPTPANRSQVEPRPGTSIAQNQPRVGKLEVVSSKKESKVTSFLKKTGRILRKPFKL